MINENDGVSATETAVEAQPRAVTNVIDLTNMIKSQKAESVIAEESVTEEKPEEVSEPTSSPEASEGAEQSAGEAEVETKVEEPNAGDVLSQHEKTLKKMRKSIDKNHRLRKEAEESSGEKDDRIQELERKVDELSKESSQPPAGEAPKGFSQQAQEAESLQDLQAIQETATSVMLKADELLDQMNETGESEIEYNGRILSRQEVRDAKYDATETITSQVDKRRETLNYRAEYDRHLVQEFDFFRDEKSEYFKLAEQFMANPAINSYVNSDPEGMGLIALAVEGRRAIDLRGEVSEKGKTEEAPVKVASTPKVAPVIPGLKSSVAPARATGDEQLKQKRAEILSKPTHDINDLASLLSKR